MEEDRFVKGVNEFEQDVKETLLKKRIYKQFGYEIRYIKHECKGNPTIVMRRAYTIPDGYYIGNPRLAWRLWNKWGIRPEPMDEIKRAGDVCCIGFSEKEQKWYGWSHRAMCGFKIGDVVKKGDCTAESGWTDEYLKEHPEEDLSLPVGFVAQNLDDCKKMAIAFAESVS